MSLAITASAARFFLVALRVTADSRERSSTEMGGFSNRLSMNWRSAAKIATAPVLRTSTKCRRAIRTHGATHSIVNPAKLKPWLADNICMSCHQNGDAMVLRPGKDYRDFKPGMPLDDTLAIFMVPPRRDSPQTDLLEHYFSMTLSKCYRGSAGRLSCITCHDPHVEPAKQEAPAQFRAKCLECHNEKSCALPAATRQRKTPPDDCAGCHMPKRQVQRSPTRFLQIIASSRKPKNRTPMPHFNWPRHKPPTSFISPQSLASTAMWFHRSCSCKLTDS